MKAVPQPPDQEARRNLAPPSTKLNRETIREVLGESLPGIEDVRLVMVHVQPFWQRCAEQLTFNITGSLVAAAIAFGAGVYVGSGDNVSKASTQPRHDVQMPVR
jgi:hypothetical protein